jgi:hypothetical protein
MALAGTTRTSTGGGVVGRLGTLGLGSTGSGSSGSIMSVSPSLRTPAVRLSDRPVVLEGADAAAPETYAFYDNVSRRVTTVRRDMDVRTVSLDGSPDVALKCVESYRIYRVGCLTLRASVRGGGGVGQDRQPRHCPRCVHVAGPEAAGRAAVCPGPRAWRPRSLCMLCSPRPLTGQGGLLRVLV